MEYFTPRTVKTTKIAQVKPLSLSDDCESEIMVCKLKGILNMLRDDQQRYEAQFAARQKQLTLFIEEKQSRIQELVNVNSQLEGKIRGLENDKEQQKRTISRMELKQKGIMTRLVASSRVTKEKMVIVKYLEDKIEKLTCPTNLPNLRMDYSCVDNFLVQSKFNTPISKSINFNKVQQKDNNLLESQLTINRLHNTEIKTPVSQQEEDTATQHGWVRTSIRITSVTKDEDSETKCPDLYRNEALTWRRLPRNQSPMRNLSKSSKGSRKSSHPGSLERNGLSFSQSPLRQSLTSDTQNFLGKHYFRENQV